MSANISALNLAVSGTTAINGFITLSAPLLSSEGGNFNGILTTELNTTGIVTHNVMPFCNVLPVASGELTNKAYVDTKNTAQDVRLAAIDAVQDGRITAEEVKTQNITYSVANSRTTLTGSSTVSGLMTFTVNPQCSILPISASQLANKQYIDQNIQVVNNSILVTNNAATALTTRVTNVEGVNTAQATSITAIQGVNTAQATSITSLETRATTIEGVNTAQATSITAIQGVNTSQSTSITSLQQKTTAIVYTTPVTGNLTEINSSLTLLPNAVGGSVLRAFSFFCNGMTCAVQATFGGTGLNQGITTSQLTVGGFGTTVKTVYFGSITSTAGNNLFTFTTPLTGAFPKVFLQGTNGVAQLTNKTLSGFIFTTNPAVINVDYWVVQGL